MGYDGMVREKSWPVTSVARILIVDDDRSIRRTLEKFLGGEGYEVATAQDAPGAIEAAGAADLMLLDLGLPGGSGFDVLTALVWGSDRAVGISKSARSTFSSSSGGAANLSSNSIAMRVLLRCKLVPRATLFRKRGASCRDINSGDVAPAARSG